ncbi:MAG TPA: hypothetical protein VF040_12330, partial [Ktedonobacterales bacterium]
MGEQNIVGEPENDFQLEVTDLHTGADIAHPLDASAQTTMKRQGEETTPPPRLPVRTRRMRAVAIGSIVLLAVVIVALVDPAVRLSITTALHPPPAPSPTLLPDANLIFLESGAPWSTYSLDGQKPSPLSQLAMHRSSTWLRLARGRHTLRVTQPPFPSLTCTISVPAARGDTCPIVGPQASPTGYFGSQSSPTPNSRVVDLGARFDRLSPADAAALLDTVRTILPAANELITIIPGDHYLADDGTVMVARTRLQSTLQLDLASPDRSVPSDSARCQALCDELTSSQSGSGMAGFWSLVVVARGSWRISASDGQIIAAHAPLWPNASAYASIPAEAHYLRTRLLVDWNGGWQVANGPDFRPVDPPTLCDIAAQMTGILLGTSPQLDTSSMNVQDGQGIYAGHGCVVTLTLSDPSATGPLAVYYHVGALLAANDAAHRAFPGLPVASANEQAQARAILGRP